MPWTLKLQVEVVIAHSSLWFDLRANVHFVAMLFHLFHHLGLASKILESRDVNRWPESGRGHDSNAAFGTLAVAFVLLLARVPQPNWLLI